MGGKAFLTGTSAILTPRLPPSLYSAILAQLTSRLQTLYAHVSAPPPAPAKSSHGDIDLLICLPLTSPPPSALILSSLLDAKQTLSTPPSYSFAIPHPEAKEAYVQIDVRVCEDVHDWKWKLFHHAYGDLWNLLGTTIRPWGVVINDRGLHLRIDEIAALDRKRSLVFLTRGPRVVCGFLGMDTEWLGIDEEGVIHAERSGSGSMEDIYAMVVRLRFFRREAYVRTTLKANGRKRLAQREGYRNFVDEWLPKHTGTESHEHTELTREGVMEEMFERFGVRGEYEKRVKEWREERERLRVKKEAKEERRRVVEEEEKYADAWMKILGNGQGEEAVGGG